jgi:hypothetical protein
MVEWIPELDLFHRFLLHWALSLLSRGQLAIAPRRRPPRSPVAPPHKTACPTVYLMDGLQGECPGEGEEGLPFSPRASLAVGPGLKTLRGRTKSTKFLFYFHLR